MRARVRRLHACKVFTTFVSPGHASDQQIGVVLWIALNALGYSLVNPRLNTQSDISIARLASCTGSCSMLTRSMPFDQAAPLWLVDHAQYIKPGTLRVYKQHVKTLCGFFQCIPLDQIQISNIRAFQRERLAHASPAVVNMEIRSVMIPMMKEVELWQRIEPVYRTVPEPKKKVRQSMSDEEERRFLAVALDASKPRRLLGGHCLVVMENTSMGFGELRHLKREDVILNEDIPFVTVNEGCKNDFRIRTIPLNWMALRSMKWILRRWET
jgi:hypothetical protein